jgi:uncharacterized HAD superfamily protein
LGPIQSRSVKKGTRPEQVPHGEVLRSDPGFHDFLLAEYNNIAQAHFKTVDSLSSFINHYVLIASVPVSILVVTLNLDQTKAGGVMSSLLAEPLVPAVFLSVIALVGLMILAYVTNVRCDAILYARTVNGIRRHFFETSELSLQDELQLRSLPRTNSRPRYLEPTYFLFVVLTFALIGTGYAVVGWFIYLRAVGLPMGYLALPGVVFAMSHVLGYMWLCRRRERDHLRSHIIGVDIDGVLNAHRHHFATTLNERVGKAIDPDSITRIPVHEMGGAVTEADEHAVFNWAPYWRDLPIKDPSLPAVLDKLRNLFGFEIWLFTHRGWPQESTFPTRSGREYWRAWETISLWAYLRHLRFLRGVDAWLERRGIAGPLYGRLMRSVTRDWLRRNKLSYDKLVIERGNTNTTDPSIRTRNRFLIARERELRIFVEDDLTKAKRLSNICEVVFLLDHPYNQAEHLPKNLIRVKSWRDIHDHIKQLF